ncbi:hypothetical protein L2E82_50090 [Cichorium intybus]|nr:hypothetical protein L2E82_50090 [Cichorium intybus]
MSSVNSPPSPPSPISESLRKHLPNMERLTGLNCKEWLRSWRLVLAITSKLQLIKYPIPISREQVIIKSLNDEHNFLVDESEEIRNLMLLTIDPKFRRDFESTGPYELMQSVEEKFQKPIEEERARIFKRPAECKLKEGSNIDSHVLQIEAYTGELYQHGYSMSQEMSVDILLALLTSSLSWKGIAPMGSDTVTERLEDAPGSKSFESSGSDTVTERLEDAPGLKSFESSGNH